MIARDRITLHRCLRDRWLGDFARPADLLAVIARFLDEPDLPPEQWCPSIGHLRWDGAAGDDRRSVDVVPFAGSNVDKANVYYKVSDRRLDRIELSLHTPCAVDFRELARRARQFCGPRSVLVDKDSRQYLAECPTNRFLGIVLLNTVDQRSGPIQLVSSIILDKVLPGADNPFARNPGPPFVVEGTGSRLR